MTNQELMGAILRERRRATGRSARAVSLAAGLSDSIVGKVERGNHDTSLRVFAAIARQLDLTDREIAFLVRLAAARTPEPVAAHRPA